MFYLYKKAVDSVEIKDIHRLKKYLKDQSKVRQISINSGYTYYFCREFLERLFNDKRLENFVLVGSFAQFVNVGEIKRPITDIDIVAPDRAYGVSVIHDIVEKSRQSEMPLDITVERMTRDDTLDLRIQYSYDKIKQLITLNMKEGQSLTLVRRSLPDYFKGDKPFEVAAISLEEHIARKIVAVCVELDSYKTGQSFKRVKDLYDIYWLSTEQYDGDKIAEYFEHYQDHYGCGLNPALLDYDFIVENQQLWNYNVKAHDFKGVSLTEAVDSTRQLMQEKLMPKSKSSM